MIFFFFKQKTAYEMRISDWSSDVCSSDLFGDKHAVFDLADQRVARHLARRHREVARRDAAATRGMAGGLEPQLARGGAIAQPGFEHAVSDDHGRRAGQSLTIIGTRAPAAGAGRIVGDVDR